jgi:hypothetical protein
MPFPYHEGVLVFIECDTLKQQMQHQEDQNHEIFEKNSFKK